MPRTQFIARYDFRIPDADPAERQEVYARALDQAAYADANGFDGLVLSEHHVSADGYLPSPIPVASAFAAVTSRIPISISALLVNLYDPIRLAEDIAVLDHLSAGRVSYTLGLGYRREEYDLFGVSWETRGADIEARIQRILEVWADGTVLPAPFSRPHPFLFYGGGSLAAARRAARLGLHFQPQHGDPALKEAYDAQCRDLGRDPGFVLQAPRGPGYVFCARDPEEFWDRYGHHLLHDAVTYAQWHGDNASYVVDGSTTVEGMQATGMYAVFEPDDLIERCRSGEVRLVTMIPACAGLPAEPSWESLRLVGDTVMPAVRG